MDALSKITYGLYVLSARNGEKDNACIINTASLMSVYPETVAICVNKASFTHTLISKTHKFEISVINADANFSLFERFGFTSGETTDKFKDFFDYKRDKNGIIYITRGTNAHIGVEVEKSTDFNTHTLFSGKIYEQGVLNNVPSLSYDRYYADIKPK